MVSFLGSIRGASGRGHAEEVSIEPVCQQCATEEQDSPVPSPSASSCSSTSEKLFCSALAVAPAGSRRLFLESGWLVIVTESGGDEVWNKHLK